MQESQEKETAGRGVQVLARAPRLYDFPRWLDVYKSRPGTRNTYTCGARAFLTCVLNATVEKGNMGQLEELAAEYIAQVKAQKREVFDDLVAFIQSDIQTSSLHPYLAAAREFLLYCCGLELGTRDRRELKGYFPKGMGEAVTKDGILTREKLKAILSHLDIKMKALVFVLLSGIRVGEALQLTPSDITGDNPAMVSVRAGTTKEGHSYFSFLTSEAVQALNEWLKVREAYINSGVFERNYNRTAKSRQITVPPRRQPTADLVFPFPYSSVSRSFGKAVKAAGLYIQDAKTKRATIHIHLLRKYFSSMMKKNVPPEVVETFLGHRGYLGGVYNNQLQPSDYVAAYQKGMGQLLVFEDTEKLEAVKAELGDKNMQFTQVAAYNQALADQNKNLLERMAKWEAFAQKFMNMSNEQLTQIGEAAVAAGQEPMAEEATGERA